MDVDPQDRYGRVLAYAYTADGWVFMSFVAPER
jgi:endonuclease YncB( thermonuclease family)